MNRLHRKCLVGSAMVHGLLLMVLLLGAAFRSAEPPPIEFPLLSVIPSRIVDELLTGGGQPEANPPPTPTSQPPATVPVVTPPPEPVVQPTKPIVKPEPVVVAPAPQSKQPEPKPAEPKPPEKKAAEPKPAEPKLKPSIKVNPKTTQINQPAKQQMQPSVDAKMAETIQSKFQSAATQLNRALTPRTSIEVPGPGGEAFANYSQVVISVYQQQWIKPVGIEKTAVVKATVTIARDGRVISHTVTGYSGNRTVNDSVDQVLQRVKKVAPFPAGAQDATRTFNLSFELTPADLSG